MYRNKTWPVAALAAGLIAIGCGRDESAAGKSAAAIEETRQKGQTSGGEGHSHGGHAGHGAVQHGAGHEGMDHSAHGASGGASGGKTPADHSTMDHGAGAHAGHAPQRSGSSRTEPAGGGHEGHAGHGTPTAQAPADHSGHAGHSAPVAGTPTATVPELPAQPAGILQPDPLDAPAATSVVDAQRSAEMNPAMSGHGGHGGPGAGTYRHVDAGRGPEAHEGSEHHEHGAAGEEAAVYVCPMHPEVTSKTPGTCPKCGMALVERREE